MMTHLTPCMKKSEKMNELGRKKLGQTHAVGKECKAIVLLSPDRDSPRQLWGLCRGNHNLCMYSTPPWEPSRWETAATYVCVWSKLDTKVNTHAHRLHWTQSPVLLQHKISNLYTYMMYKKNRRTMKFTFPFYGMDSDTNMAGLR